MEAQFRLLDAEIEAEVLPSPYNEWRSIIGCNDCQARSNVKFHFLGLKCSTCKSYNTVQIKLLKPEEVEGDDGSSNTRLHRRYLAGLDANDVVSSDLASTSEYTDDVSDSEFDILPRRNI
jgi:phage FluMu protein Com